MPTNIRDPRTLVTPDAFRIDEGLLGTPLADPWRRLWALLIDLVVIGALTVFLDSIQLFVWGVVALFFIHVAFRRPGRASQAAAFLLRLFAGCLGLTILAAVVLAFLVARSGGDRDGPPGPAGFAGGVVEQVGARIALETLREVDDGEGVVDASVGVLETLEEMGRAPADPLAFLEENTPDDAAWAAERDSLYRVAVARWMEGGEGEAEAEEERDDHRSALAEVGGGDGGFVELLRDIWDQAGSAIGLWSIYFTVLLTLWKGRTVGKRVLGLRVLRLDGEPMTWWTSFERAGGYVAGIATGTLGFAQVFWDPNRQCIHDKIVGTVVVREGAERVEGAWLEARTSQPGDSRPPTPRPRTRPGASGGT